MSAGIWVIHTGPKSGGELVTLFDSYSYDGVSAGIWVIHIGPKSGGELVTLFDRRKERQKDTRNGEELTRTEAKFKII